VANTVDSCSDSTASDPTKKASWRGRKEKYLEHLRNASGDALLVAAADKLHNARAMLSDAREMGENSWSRFKAPKEDQLWLFAAIIETLRHTTAPRMLVDELDRVVAELKKL
jgi:(p)ppGpp synthase/HD superfamily hydrolase